jgi:hypothetical protein
MGFSMTVSARLPVTSAVAAKRPSLNVQRYIWNKTVGKKILSGEYADGTEKFSGQAQNKRTSMNCIVS